MKNRKLIIAAAALAAVVALLAGVFFAARPDAVTNSAMKSINSNLVFFAARPDAVTGSKTVTVTVVHRDGSEKTFTYRTDAETLGQVLYGEGLIQAEGVDQGMFNIVDGEKADWNANQSYWSLYEGDDYATEGVDTLIIQDGDAFRLVYTIG